MLNNCRRLPPFPTFCRRSAFFFFPSTQKRHILEGDEAKINQFYPLVPVFLGRSDHPDYSWGGGGETVYVIYILLCLYQQSVLAAAC